MIKRIIKNSCLFNGDALSLMPTLIRQGRRVDMIFTDPPYKIIPHGSSGTMSGMCLSDLNRKGRVFEHNDIHIKDWAPMLYALLKDGGHCYVMVNNYNLSEFLNVLQSTGFHFSKLITWDKQRKTCGRFYMNQSEFILFLWKTEGRKINRCGTPDIWSFPNKKTKDTEGKNIHDTEKPVELFERAIINSSTEGEIVFDPFMGIGGCAVAARKTGRRFVGCEISVKYFKSATLRVEN